MLPPERKDNVSLLSEVVSEEVDLKVYPRQVRDPSDKEVTIGDLHGNTMKFIWIMIHEGAMEMSETDFNRMWQLYDNLGNSPNENSSSDLTEFQAILRQAKLNPKVKLRLIGNVFADRGNNDYLTLKVLEKLHTSGVSPEIIYSNHDATLLYNYNQEISNWVLDHAVRAAAVNAGVITIY